jgi:O-methyltransferase involved in polyketide biosynthesis
LEIIMSIGDSAYEKISPTAKLVAHIRTFTDIPFAAEIAAESGAQTAFEALAGAKAEPMIPFIPMWEARYKATDRIIEEQGMTQILEIAAGLSPRGLAMTVNPEVISVATDLPQILEQERTIAQAILTRLNSRRPNLYFQVANALDRESLSRAAAVFRPDRPIAIITEGLLPYFTHPEKAILARNIHELLTIYGGIWITPDLSTRQSWGNVAHSDEHIRQRLRVISHSTDRSLASNAFADENDLNQFFAGAGFTIQEYSQAELFEALTSITRLDLDREETRLILRGLKTLILTAT